MGMGCTFSSSSKNLARSSVPSRMSARGRESTEILDCESGSVTCSSARAISRRGSHAAVLNDAPRRRRFSVVVPSCGGRSSPCSKGGARWRPESSLPTAWIGSSQASTKERTTSSTCSPTWRPSSFAYRKSSRRSRTPMDTAVPFRSRVLSAVRWSAGAKLASQSLSWVITIVVIRLLRPEDYGLMAMATIFVGLLTLFNELGVAAPIIAMFFDEPRLVLLMRVLALQFVIVAFSVVPQSLLERELSFKRRSLADLVSTTIGALATLVLAFLGHGVWALVWGNLAQLSSNMVLVNLARPYLRWPSFKLAGLRDVATFGGYVSMARLLWYFYAQADIFIGGRLLGHE